MVEIFNGTRNAIVTPGQVLSRHLHDKFSDFAADRRTAGILPALGAVELAGDQPAIPGQNGVGLGHAGDLLERLAISIRLPSPLVSSVDHPSI